MVRFREILKNRNFSLLCLAQVLSQFGDRLIQLSLIALVYRLTPGSTFQLAKSFSFTILPVFLISSVAGVYVDRWNHKTTLFICDLLRVILVLSIPLIFISKVSLVPIYVIIFLIFCISRFYVPAKLSIIPDLVEERELLLANSLANTTGMIAAALIGLGGIIIEVFGERVGFYLAGSVFFLAAILILFIRKQTKAKKRENIFEVGKEVFEVIKKSVIAEINEGLVYLFSQTEIRRILSVFFLLGAAAGSVYIVWIDFIQGTLGTVTRDLGLLITFMAIGLFIGNLIYGRFGQRLSTNRTIFFSMGLFGLALCMFVFLILSYPYFLVAAILAIVLGLTASPILTASYTLIHKVSSEEMRGKVFSNLEIVIHLAFLIFMLASARLAENIGGSNILIGVGCILVILGTFGFFNTKKVAIIND